MSLIDPVLIGDTGGEAKDKINMSMKDLVGHSVGELDDVDLSGVAVSDLVQWDGSKLVPAKLPKATVTTSLYLMNNNTTVTVSDDNISTFNIVLNDNGIISTPAPIYDGDWIVDPDSLVLTFNGSSGQDFKIACSGQVTSDSTGATDHISIRMVEVGGVMTGSTKRYPAGRSAGQVTSEVGFTTVGYGHYENSNHFQLEISKDFLGAITVKDVIIAIEPL